MNNNEKDTRIDRLITEPKIARKLLKLGHFIVDIKPNKSNPDKSVFIFRNTDKFKSDLEEVLAYFAKKDNESEAKSDGLTE